MIFKVKNFNYKCGWVVCDNERTDGADKGGKLKQIPVCTKSRIMKPIKTTVSCIYLYRSI
jgi:hypothetical protein